MIENLFLVGEGLLNRSLSWGWDWACPGGSRAGWGLLVRRRTLAGSRLGTDWERLLRLPLLSDYSARWHWVGNGGVKGHVLMISSGEVIQYL